jgi:phage shock protein A
MSIFRRTADVFAANLNEFVDRFEEPQRMLRHALREMEALLSATSSAVARSIATERLLEKTRAEHAAQADDWQRRAATSIDEGDEVLARRAIARQLDHRRAQSATDRQLADARDANETLRRQLDLLRYKHAAARTRLMTLAARQTAADAHRQMLTTSRSPLGQARALARFDRFYEQVEFAQAEAAALVELEAHGDAALETEFDRRATEQTIDDELARLKASRHSGQA